jgi:hypothetical protein
VNQLAVMVITCVLVAVPAAALAADAPDAGPSTAAGAGVDGGTAFDLKFNMPEQANLQGGSELAAGVDPNAGEEIVHPGDMADLQAGFRKIGSVFQEGNGSGILQFNPYVMLLGREKTYHEITRVHDQFPGRLATDMLTTIALAAGSPYSTADATRFSTLALGFAFELFGPRCAH